jgi:hypothetical protein
VFHVSKHHSRLDASTRPQVLQTGNRARLLHLLAGRRRGWVLTRVLGVLCGALDDLAPPLQARAALCHSEHVDGAPLRKSAVKKTLRPEAEPLAGVRKISLFWYVGAMRQTLWGGMFVVLAAACSSGSGGGGGSIDGGGSGGTGTGGTGTGGTGTGGTSGGKCQAACENVASANCPGAADVPTCISECEADLGSGACTAEAQALADCVATANITCTSSGSADIFGACSVAQAFAACTACTPSAGDDACDTCSKSTCCSERTTLFGDPNLFPLIECLNPCADAACAQGCQQQFPDAYNALLAVGECESACPACAT